MSNNEFDLNFDFEKEYTEADFDLDALADELGLDLSDEPAEENIVEEAAPEAPAAEEPAAEEAKDNFELRSILDNEFDQGEMFGAEYEPDFDYGPEDETPAAPKIAEGSYGDGATLKEDDRPARKEKKSKSKNKSANANENENNTDN